MSSVINIVFLLVSRFSMPSADLCLHRDLSVSWSLFILLYFSTWMNGAVSQTQSWSCECEAIQIILWIDYLGGCLQPDSLNRIPTSCLWIACVHDILDIFIFWPSFFTPLTLAPPDTCNWILVTIFMLLYDCYLIITTWYLFPDICYLWYLILMILTSHTDAFNIIYTENINIIY